MKTIFFLFLSLLSVSFVSVEASEGFKHSELEAVSLGAGGVCALEWFKGGEGKETVSKDVFHCAQTGSIVARHCRSKKERDITTTVTKQPNGSISIDAVAMGESGFILMAQADPLVVSRLKQKIAELEAKNKKSE